MCELFFVQSKSVTYNSTHTTNYADGLRSIGKRKRIAKKYMIILNRHESNDVKSELANVNECERVFAPRAESSRGIDGQ